MAKVEYIKKLKAVIQRHKLHAQEDFWECTDKQLTKLYYGTGPDQLGKYGRVKLIKFFEMFE
ncbi:hypothetical protein P0136_11010 [Lentisphaerota bacterium ZTH]|nr:hypothetical protein JYG24_11470 [Lentisphaerota bacterium]WET05891.1 hypothetical protein P0136_11010 [Lentisphaerota bacterium ZTH]